MTKQINAKVQAKKLFTTDTLLLQLRACEPFQYAAGDYLMAGFDSEDLKPFSIASSPRNDGLIELHIRNRLGTQFMEDLFKIAVGDELIISGPNKQYQLDDGLDNYQQDMILVAGGTGFAPMKSILDELLAQNFNQKIYFYWGATKQEDFYLHNEMIALEKHHDNLVYTEVLSSLVHQQVLVDYPNLADKRVYLCGTWDMVTAAKKAFLGAGLAEENYN